MSSGFRLGSDSGSHPGNENWQDGREESAVRVFSLLVPFLWGCLGLLYPVKKGCWSSQGGLFCVTIPVGFLLLVSPLSLWLHWPGYMLTTSSRLPLSLVALLYPHFRKWILSDKPPGVCHVLPVRTLTETQGKFEYSPPPAGRSVRMAAVALLGCGSHLLASSAPYPFASLVSRLPTDPGIYPVASNTSLCMCLSWPKPF